MSEPRLRYRYDLHLAEAAADTAVLIDERRVHVLEGALYGRLLPLLDGQRTADELVDALYPTFEAADVYYAVAQLQKRGLVVEATDLPLPRAAFWSALGGAPVAVAARLAAARVEVRTAGTVDGDAVRRALAQGLYAGTRDGDAAQAVAAATGDGDAAQAVAAATGDGDAAHEAPDLVVWAVDDYLRPELDAFNRTHPGPWMILKPVGMELWIGPIFERGQGCWQCLAHRLSHHRQVQQLLLRREGRGDPLATSLAALPSTVDTACGLGATEAARYLGGVGSRVVGRVLTLDAATLETREHVLRRRPTCEICGTSTAVERSPRIALEACPIGFVEDGGFRTMPPERTLDRLRDLVSPITGIVPVLQPRASDAAGLISACVSGFNVAFAADDFNRLRRTMRLITAGKGKSEAQTRASALAEAVERHCGAFHGDEPRRRARLDELGPEALHPDTLTMFSERQYAARTRRTFNWVPAPFDASEAIEWTPAWSLTHDAPRWLPTWFCYVGHDPHHAADSNGNAAGNTLEEAVLQGLLELTERDAVAVWWYNRVPRPALLLESLEEPYVLRLRDAYRAIGRDIWVLDITHDLGVPCYAAVSRRVDAPHEEIVLGFGAHLDPRLAVLRAMTEINQFVSGIPSEGPPSRGVDPDFDAWLDAIVARETYLAPCGQVEARRHPYPLDLRDNVLALQHTLEARGMEIIVLDQSRPDVDLRVVKVVVPGLRHFWERFAPGRLYDVPVQLGWLPSPTPEEALNPLRMFL